MRNKKQILDEAVRDICSVPHTKSKTRRILSQVIDEIEGTRFTLEQLADFIAEFNQDGERDGTAWDWYKFMEDKMKK